MLGEGIFAKIRGVGLFVRGEKKNCSIFRRFFCRSVSGGRFFDGEMFCRSVSGGGERFSKIIRVRRFAEVRFFSKKYGQLTSMIHWPFIPPTDIRQDKKIFFVPNHGRLYHYTSLRNLFPLLPYNKTAPVVFGKHRTINPD